MNVSKIIQTCISDENDFLKMAIKTLFLLKLKKLQVHENRVLMARANVEVYKS